MRYKDCPRPWKLLYASGFSKVNHYGDGGNYKIQLIDICPANNTLFGQRLQYKKNTTCLINGAGSSLKPLKVNSQSELIFMGHGTATASVSSSEIGAQSYQWKQFAYECNTLNECQTAAEQSHLDKTHNTFAWYGNSKMFVGAGYDHNAPKLTLCGAAPKSVIKNHPVSYNLNGRFFPPGNSSPFSVFPKIIKLGKTSTGTPIKPLVSNTLLYVLPSVANFDDSSQEGQIVQKLADEICKRRSVTDIDTKAKLIIFVVAAGNFGQDLANNNYLPAAYKNAQSKYPGCNPFLVVGGIKTDNVQERHDKSNYNSNYVDIATYYDQYVISQPANTARIDEGTSYGAPLVASLIARLLKCRPTASPEEVTKQVYYMSEKYPSLESHFSGGRVLLEIKEDQLKSWCTMGLNSLPEYDEL